MRIVVTGSYGLVGLTLAAECSALGYQVVPFDVARPDADAVDDIRDPALLSAALEGCDGVVHLAAISRVAWGEARPDLCHSVNVDGTAAIVRAVLAAKSAPWLLFASSREVYGDPARALIDEDEPIAPINHYGRSKAEGEALVDVARKAGARTAITRLSNVYGGPRDHPDRAVPSLVWRALKDEALRITGSGNYFDFVHVRDTVAGLLAVIARLVEGESDLPPIQFTTGVATSLGALAKRAVEIAGSASPIIQEPPRAFDVSGFCGSPLRAERLLGWRPRIELDRGIADLAADLRASGPLPLIQIPDPDAIRAAGA